ncbi:MAG: hypothetical protein AB201_03555 [Parcubacteria bacterium C7867-006]|nr:MAG: hypothetical protein AB201_03555 [Parcubacteria bacterium C7867-006]
MIKPVTDCSILVSGPMASGGIDAYRFRCRVRPAGSRSQPRLRSGDSSRKLGHRRVGFARYQHPAHQRGAQQWSDHARGVSRRFLVRGHVPARPRRQQVGVRRHARLQQWIRHGAGSLVQPLRHEGGVPARNHGWRWYWDAERRSSSQRSGPRLSRGSDGCSQGAAWNHEGECGSRLARRLRDSNRFRHRHLVCQSRQCAECSVGKGGLTVCVSHPFSVFKF